ncbi:hypothetical protein [Paraconexibacter sp.]|uniref:hypothetical protein n=1 Tax=Paraconexibacter sp. TaxID=2949640 RepID=UPI003565CF29
MEEQNAPTPTPGDMSQVYSRVQAIVDAAERSAAALREETEQRARDRIAEADRAAANRVRAAEDEAEEILEKARADAREIVAEARGAAREVMGAGTEISRDLEQLGASLRRNAAVILKDVQHAHREMQSRIDRISPPTAADRIAAAKPERSFSVPEPVLPFGVSARRTPSSRSDAAPVDASDVPVDDIEIPEFTRNYVPQRRRR